MIYQNTYEAVRFIYVKVNIMGIGCENSLQGYVHKCSCQRHLQCLFLHPVSQWSSLHPQEILSSQPYSAKPTVINQETQGTGHKALELDP